MHRPVSSGAQREREELIHRGVADGGEPLSPGDFIGRWMELLRPAAASIGPQRDHSSFAEHLNRLEHVSAVKTLDNLMTFPCVRILVERNRLHLHAAFFDVVTGLLSVFDPEMEKFVSVAGEESGHYAMPPTKPSVPYCRFYETYLGWLLLDAINVCFVPKADINCHGFSLR